LTALPRFVHDLLRSPPHRSEGLNIWFFRAARLLWPYREEGEIVNLLKAATYGESVRSGEIERAVKRSKSCAWQPGQPNHIRDSPKWPALSVQQRLAIIRDGGGLVDLWEASPVRIDDNESHTETLIDALFPADLLLCCGKDNSHFDTRSREEWRGQLSALQLIVPSPMTARSGLTQDGKQSPHALSITGQRRFLVVEFDHGNVDDHAALFLHLAETAPLALVVHSGSKSLHGWFPCKEQTEKQLHRFMSRAIALGACDSTWSRSQFVRMPDGRRGGDKRQVVYHFDPEVLE
jgi:hypothetical protein